MQIKRISYFAFLIIILSLIGMIFWEEEYKYTRPTPKPITLKTVHSGDTINLSSFDLHNKNTYFHFYNYDCPCSRFNIKEFQSMVRKYSKQIEFVAVLQTTDKGIGAVKKFKKKYDLGIKTIHDSKGEIAKELGVYSTPQAVILKNNQVFYKGNYNKARFCLSRNTQFADMALRALLNNEEPPQLPIIANIAYGCELPSNGTSEKNLFTSLFQ